MNTIPFDFAAVAYSNTQTNKSLYDHKNAFYQEKNPHSEFFDSNCYNDNELLLINYYCQNIPFVKKSEAPLDQLTFYKRKH